MCVCLSLSLPLALCAGVDGSKLIHMVAGTANGSVLHTTSATSFISVFNRANELLVAQPQTILIEVLNEKLCMHLFVYVTDLCIHYALQLTICNLL